MLPGVDSGRIYLILSLPLPDLVLYPSPRKAPSLSPEYLNATIVSLFISFYNSSVLGSARRCHSASHAVIEANMFCGSYK